MHDDAFDFPGDVCEDCRHRLDDDGTCPSCGWKRPRPIGRRVAYDPGDDLPSIGGW